MSQSKKLIPKRRFKGFEGASEWQKYELGQLGSVAMNRRIFKEQTTNSGEIPFYKIGTFGGEPDAFISREIFEKYKTIYPYPKIGDILISASGSIGKTIEYEGKDEYFQDSNIVWLNHDERLINSFLKQFYKIVNWQGIEGSTIKRLYNKNILLTEIILPSAKEQTQIGEFFKKLDNLISTQQKKLEKAKTLKSAYLTEMFPNEDGPKRRFIGSIGLWRQKEIIEIGKIFIGLVTTMTENYTNVGTLLIRNSDIKDNKFEFSDNPIYLKDTFAQINASRRLHIGDVVTVHTGDVGTSAVITKKEENAIGFATINTRPNQNIITSEFLSVFLNSRKHKAYAQKMSTGDGRSNYNLKDFNQLIVDLPNITEQIKIGNFFKLLDDKIALEQKKLAKLKNIKQAYLNEMFV
ncbi:restriction endonuclease subunit S [Gilliamella sp. Imp1-1]|uniref:restriction endonuclease subunit S n=1 Tax=Gilliamella sp. Imp1-1 TaxID=3120248 RepID=UPI0004616090|nr:restriction endonuclease subunit S [Gilliamella apicola]KDN11370.1 Type I restriction-modification system, specificity subunit S [Gilliamella apicola]OCG57510.1 hypothetical protein A9G38_07670 [Gilliamella apicola]